MRPVLLRMDGFAAFREPTRVDFRGADYFVLVGPTGSGKSTVIDAMTFALYGSVPRWGNQHVVRDALAPTAARGTVGLVFDVGGERYVVARELRRVASGQVNVRTARLERLTDPDGTGEPGEETVPLADGARPVSKAVEELLGLQFEDFCTCVVLPQGAFADFLHAEKNKRQEKLEHILGLGVYDLIMRRANSEAAAQQQRADWLGEQHTRYTDATPENEELAAARVQALTRLGARVDAVIPELAAADAALDAARVTAERLRGEGVRLAALAAPDDVVALDTAHRAAATAVEAAALRVRETEQVDGEVRERLAAAPERAVLERICDAYAELAAVEAGLPAATAQRDEAAGAYRNAEDAAASARAGLELARTTRAAAVDTAAEAGRTVGRLTAELDALCVPAEPGDLAALGARETSTAAALQRASQLLAEAERSQSRARAALTHAPARGPLDEARRSHRLHAQACDEARDAISRRLEAREQAASAEAQAWHAHARLEQERARLGCAERADLAGGLRAALAVGEDCPVCDRAVTELPARAPTGELDAARTAVTNGEAFAEQARAELLTASGLLDVAAAELHRLTGSIARLEAELAGAPGPDEVDATLAELDRLEKLATDTEIAVLEARNRHDRAAQDAESARRATAAAAAQLLVARDPLVALGAPAPGENVVAGWRALMDWTRAAAGARESALPAARAALAAAEDALVAADARLAVAGRDTDACRAAETVAARAEQQARGTVEAAQCRAGELRVELAAAPTAEVATVELGRRVELDDQARAADTQLRAARTALGGAERDAVELARQVAAAWRVLHRARDPFVALGAPALDGDDLPAAWADLLGWTRREIALRDTALVDAAGNSDAARTARDALRRRLIDELTAHNIGVDGDEAAHDIRIGGDEIARAAPPAVAAALADARGVRTRIAERRAEAVGLAAGRAAAQEEQQVAKLLGDLLRSNRFPSWLVESALDVLVTEASRTLADLSGGQFTLTHHQREFQVIDHADADARRPVRTLSGGETFQASLALALALSTQMSGLAAEGAARLDSIFLDEGFGTLDETNLDVVASTLENLAMDGSRMVGVITHVPALAERVPVRFTLSRDQRTSSIVRAAL